METERRLIKEAQAFQRDLTDEQIEWYIRHNLVDGRIHDLARSLTRMERGLEIAFKALRAEDI